MKNSLVGILLCLAANAGAATLSYTGTLNTPESVFETTFTLSHPSAVFLSTYGFGGGVNDAGTTIPPGGFDPLLSLFSGIGPAAAVVLDSSGNPVASSDILSNFAGNCPPAGTVAIGTGIGSSVCGDVALTTPMLPVGSYTLVVSDANYIPTAVTPGPPSSSLLSDGFTDFTGGVFQTCNSDTCITPTGNYALDISGESVAPGPSAPEPNTTLLLLIPMAALGLILLRRSTAS